MIEGDQSDTRAWSDEQVATRIDAFMETIAARATCALRLLCQPHSPYRSSLTLRLRNSIR